MTNRHGLLYSDRHVRAMTRARKILLWVIGLPLALCVVGLCLGIWWLSSLARSESVEPARALAALDDVRAKFSGVSPALEIREQRLVVLRAPAPSALLPAPAAVRLLIWEPDDRRLSRLTLPFSMSTVITEPIPIEDIARVTEGGLADLMGAKRRGNELSLRLGDLERYGRTLLLDAITPEGRRVVIWNE
jgi:hypothetical protein